MTPEYALILIFILNAFAIIGINRATEYECINDELNGIVPDSRAALWWVRFYSKKIFGNFWSMAICTCCKCMPTFHAWYFYLFFYLVYAPSTSWLWFYPLYWLALSGFTHALNLKISKDE